MTNPTIRQASPEDAEAIAHIYVESWNAGFQHRMHTRTVDAELVSRWTTDLDAPPPHRWWVASQKDAIAGFIGIGPSRDPEAVVWTLEDYELGQKFYESADWERDGGKRDSGRQIRYRIKINRPSDP